MDEALTDCLREIGQAAELLRNPDGSTVLVLAHGGRILGLYAADSRENFFWTNPSLDAPDSAREFFRSEEWHNSGGDRTWLAPEADVFFPDFPDLKRYWQPRELDPGRYVLTRTGAGLGLVNRLTVVLSRSKTSLDLEIAKFISPAPNPFRYERGFEELLALDYAGYTLQTSLVLQGNTAFESPAIGAWNLVAMPHGGDLLVPTYSRTQPRIIFGPIPAEDLVANERYVRYRMRSIGDHKISVRAAAVAGRVGYLYPCGDRGALVIRNIFVDPSGEYLDFPWDDPEDLGYAVQGCNVNNSNLGSFGELEYHMPGIGRGTGRSRSDDRSTVWAFRGPRELVLRAAGILLGSQEEVKP